MTFSTNCSNLASSLCFSVILSAAKNLVISCIAFSSFYYRFSVISNEVRNPVISRFAIQDFTGCFEAMPLNMTLNASASE